MKSGSLIVTFILALGSFAKGGTLYCADTNAVIQEAVAYHLTGAPTTDFPLTCAKKMKWRYFNPNIEVKSQDGAPTKPDYIPFVVKRDSYSIEKVRRDGKRFLFDVTFSIAGKTISTTYFYEPIEMMQKYRGVCGVITHPKKPWIFRADCEKDH